MENPVFLNGDIVSYKEAKVGVEDRGYQFADGIYEVVFINNGKLFASGPHFKRLFKSAEAVGINMPVDFDKFNDMVREYIKEVDCDVGNLYVQITRGEALRTHAYPENMDPNLVMLVHDHHPYPVSYYADGVDVITVSDDRWSKCYIKSISLLPNILAKKRAKEQGVYEAVFIRDDFVMEGSSTNIFAVIAGELITYPASNYILNGITRQQIINIAERLGFKVYEKPITLSELYQADEVFLTGTSTEVMPVVKVNSQIIGDGSPGSWSQHLLSEYRKLIIKETGSEPSPLLSNLNPENKLSKLRQNNP